MASLMDIEEPPRPAPKGFALFALGFRPFYLLASVFAALSVPLWALQFSGMLGQTYLSGSIWHAHEMLFGFTLFMMWLAYFSLALNAIMAVTEYYLALTITGILMPFGVLGPTRWIAMKPVSYFLATGLKLMVIACLAAISRDLLGNIKFPDAEPTFRQMLVAFSSASTLGLLCWLAPQRLAAGIMAGATSMGPSDAVSVATNAATTAPSGTARRSRSPVASSPGEKSSESTPFGISTSFSGSRAAVRRRYGTEAA